MIINTISNVNDDVIRICNWESANGLILNAAKSQAMIISTRNVITEASTLPPILISDSPIQFCDHATSLGLVMDRHMDRCYHVSGVSAKEYGRFRNLCSHCATVPTSTRCVLVKSLLLPILTYASLVFSSGLNSTTKNIIYYRDLLFTGRPMNLRVIMTFGLCVQNISVLI